MDTTTLPLGRSENLSEVKKDETASVPPSHKAMGTDQANQQPASRQTAKHSEQIVRGEGSLPDNECRLPLRSRIRSSRHRRSIPRRHRVTAIRQHRHPPKTYRSTAGRAAGWLVGVGQWLRARFCRRPIEARGGCMLKYIVQLA